MAAVRRHAHERLCHEAGDEVELARDLRANLAVGRQAVGRAQRIVVGEIKLELTWGVLMVALNHVEAHGVGVLDHAHEHRAQALELVDVVAIGLGEAAIRPAVLVLLQPHHLRLAAHAHVHVVLLLELGVVDAQIAAAVGRQMTAALVVLLAIAEAGAEHPRHPLVPGQLHERLGIGNADQLGGLGPVADVLSVAIREEVGRRSIDELEALLRRALPVVGRNALADDAARHRDELIVDVSDAELVDLLAHLPDEIAAAGRVDVILEIACRVH